MNQNSRDQFARWLAGNYPELFEALAAQAANSGNLEGWTDIFASIGSGISKAGTAVAKYGTNIISAVSDFVGSENGQKSLATVAGLYLTTQANKDAVKVQLGQMQAGQPPVPIQTVTQPLTGITTPFYVPQGQAAQAFTPSLAQQLMGGAASGQTLLLVGVGAFVLTYMLARR